LDLWGGRSVLLAGTLCALLASGCGGEPASEGSAADPAASTVPTLSGSPAPLAGPTVDGLFAVADDGRRLNLACWGQGRPTVVLESGHPDGAGVSDFGQTEFARVLAARTRVCAYDRAGWGASDPAPDEPRTADHVIGDLRALLRAANLDPPYVLVGSSFGGMIVTYYAHTHPDDVAGVVLLDVPAPSAALSTTEIPEIAWDHPANPEHLDIVTEFEGRFATQPVSFPAPLAVVTATGGQSSVQDQRVWLRASPNAHQTQLDGGHQIYLDDPAGAAAEVIRLTQRDRG
jgi:pimeloyl-ACP methyl ester carboxylesterase